MGARHGLEDARDEAPGRAGQHPAGECDRDRDEARLGADGDARGDRAEGAHQELALGADVEQASLEAEADRQAGQQERCRRDERVDDGIAVRREAEGTLEQGDVGP